MRATHLRDRPPRVPQMYSTDTYHHPSRLRATAGQVAFIQDQHSIKDIMKSQGFGRELSRTVSQTFLYRRSLGVVGQAPPPIPKYTDTVEALDEVPSYDSFEPAPEEVPTVDGDWNTMRVRHCEVSG